MGVGLGAIIRNQVGAVITLLARSFVVDNLLIGLVPSIGRFTPTRAEDALVGLTAEHLLSPAAGAIVLIAWAATLALIAVPLVTRRDVTWPRAIQCSALSKGEPTSPPVSVLRGAW